VKSIAPLAERGEGRSERGEDPLPDSDESDKFTEPF
jgi:hypothetical protein